MKRLRDWLAKRDSDQILLALTLIGLAPVLAGFFFLDGFTPHVIAGFAGLVLGAVLAVVLIENLLHQRRRQDWHLAREEMVISICQGLVQMGGSFAIEMPGHRYLTFAETSADVTQEMAGALDELATAARSVATSLAASLESDVASTRAVYDQSARALEPLHGAITRVIMLGDEPDLVKRMLALERALRVWGTWVTEVEHAGAPDSIAWEQAISALETGTEVYKYFVAQMESSLPPPGPARKDPWDSGPELIACSALMGVLPFMLWSGGEVASGLFGFASRWRTVVFIAAAAVSLSGFAVLQDRPDDDLLPRAILLGAWLLLVFVIEPVLGLGLSAEAALKAYGIALLLILSCFVVLAPGSFLRYTPSWLLAWGGLCALFAYLAHRLVLYQ